MVGEIAADDARCKCVVVAVRINREMYGTRDQKREGEEEEEGKDEDKHDMVGDGDNAIDSNGDGVSVRVSDECCDNKDRAKVNLQRVPHQQ